MSSVGKVWYPISRISFQELLKTVIGCDSPETALVCVQTCHKTCEELSDGDDHEHLR